MKDYITLRKQYTDFIYHGWEIDETDTSFTITYAFEIVGLQSFHPTFTLPKPHNHSPYMQARIFHEAVFSLGMVENRSCALSPSIRMLSGSSAITVVASV